MSTVSYGYYFGFTLAELLVELEKYKLAVQSRGTSGGKEIINGSINGKNITFSIPAGWSLEKWQVELQKALYELDSDTYEWPASTTLGSMEIFE